MTRHESQNPPPAVRTARAISGAGGPCWPVFAYSAPQGDGWREAEREALAWLATPQARRLAYRLARDSFPYEGAARAWAWAGDVLARAQGDAQGRESSYRLAGNTPERNAADMAAHRARCAQDRRNGPGAATLGAPWHLGAYAVQWCERPPMRHAGDVADLLRGNGRGHIGYFLGAFGDGETVNGAVYLLPGRRGQVRAVPALACPHNDGAAALALGDVVEGPGDDLESILADAAQVADGLAERYAESEREHDSAYQAGHAAAVSLERAREARRDFLEIKAAQRAAQGRTARPRLCEALARTLADLADTWRREKRNAASLADGAGEIGDTWGPLCWNTRDESLRGAFGDGLESI